MVERRAAGGKKQANMATVGCVGLRPLNKYPKWDLTPTGGRRASCSARSLSRVCSSFTVGAFLNDPLGAGSTLHRPKRRLAGNRLLGAPPPHTQSNLSITLSIPPNHAVGGSMGERGRGDQRLLAGSQPAARLDPPPPLPSPPGGPGGGVLSAVRQAPVCISFSSFATSAATSTLPASSISTSGAGLRKGGGVRWDCPRCWKRGEEMGTEKKTRTLTSKKTTTDLQNLNELPESCLQPTRRVKKNRKPTSDTVELGEGTGGGLGSTLRTDLGV